MTISESRVKHLEFLQGVISRMASNGFLLKAWAVTLVAALFALAAKDADNRYFLVAYLPVVIFWLLDAYYLSLERRYRALYDEVRNQPETEADFSMDTTDLNTGRSTWPCALISVSLVGFYIPLALSVLLVIAIVK